MSQGDISVALEKVPISIDLKENAFPNFNYIIRCVSGPGASLPVDAFYPGCDCKDNDCQADRHCQCVAKYGAVYEEKSGQLVKTNVHQSSGLCQPVFECNSLCACSESCGNRLVQHGITTRLHVFKTDTKGWGLRALEDITQGQFVCEYAGEVISYVEAKRRTQEQIGDNYIIVIKEHVSGNQILCTHVDPKVFGNAGRFINHACDPNLVMIPVRVDSLIPILAMFSLKDIPEGTELTFNYSGDNSDNGKANGQNANTTSSKSCYCESATCLGYLPSDLSLF